MIEQLKLCQFCGGEADKGWGSSVKIIGNIIKDKWFDYEKHFEK